MSEGKLAAQVAHAFVGLHWQLSIKDKPGVIVVLGVSDKKFSELTSDRHCYIQSDLGFTEVEAGTQTAAAWFEDTE